MKEANEELCQAAEKGDIERMRAAIARGAGVNAAAPDQYSALCYATMYDQLEAVKWLLAEGASVHHVGSYGRRPLHYVKRAEIATLLIDHGAELAPLDDGGYDVLHELMTRFDNVEVATLLLDRGLKLIRYLTQPPAMHVPVSHLQWAVHCKRPETVRLLLDRGCEPNEYATYGGRVIFQAINCPPPEGNAIARLLIEAGARVAEEADLLRRLSDRKDPVLVALALARGCVVDSVVLQSAARAGDLEVLTILLEHSSASVDALDGANGTALMDAARAGQLPAVELLLRCGATPTLRDRDGATALHHAAAGRALAVFERLTTVGCRIDDETDKGWSPLEYAAKASAFEILQLLLGSGIDPDHRTRDGKTSLMIAAEAGAGLVRDMLAKAGADRSLKDADGKTEQDYALARAEYEEEERQRFERY